MPTVSINGTTVALQPGAFALTVSNAEGHSESRLYDPRFGAATQLTGPNGLSTTWTLDDFGRKVREKQPDGASVVTAGEQGGGCQQQQRRRPHASGGKTTREVADILAASATP